MEAKVEALAAAFANGCRVVASHRPDAADAADVGRALASGLEAAAPGALLLQTFGDGAAGSFLLSSGDAAAVDAAKAAVAAALDGKGGGKGGRYQGKCAAVKNAAAAVDAATAALSA